MKAIPKSAFRTGIILVCVLLSGIFIGWALHPRLDNSENKPEASCPAEKQRPHLNQKSKIINLGSSVVYSEITGESEEGEVWVRNCTITVNGNTFLMKGWDKLLIHEGKGQHLDQGYYHQGKLVLTESDTDGDGLFDLMIMFDENEMPYQAFEVGNDGMIRPLSNERVEKLKGDWKQANEIVRPMVEGVKNAENQEERGEYIKDAIKKAQEAEKRSP